MRRNPLYLISVTGLMLLSAINACAQSNDRTASQGDRIVVGTNLVSADRVGVAATI